MVLARVPRRIVCLTEETVETLYLLGAGDLVAGVSIYAVRPPEVRTKPKVSSYLKAKIDDIVALDPDLVLVFSDLQAGIASQLLERGLNIVGFNQRSVEEILAMILTLGRLVDRDQGARALVAELEGNLDRARAAARALPARPRVFLEEWHEPLIAGIAWTSELVEICGGIDVYPELRQAGLARERIVDPAQVLERRPDLILASWCGKPVEPAKIKARPGWDAMPAVTRDQIVEVDPSIWLQPGPAALSDGLAFVQAAIARAATHLESPGALSRL